MKLLPKIRAKDSVAKQEFASIRQTVNSIHEEIILQKELLLMLDYPITDAGLEELRDAAKSCQAGKLKDKALVVSVYSKLTDEQRQSRLGEEITSLLSISSTVQEGDKIVDAELKDIEGNIHHLSDYKGKYILLDFWSRYCGPCLDAFPLLKEIAEKYKEKVVVNQPVCRSRSGLEKDRSQRIGRQLAATVRWTGHEWHSGSLRGTCASFVYLYFTGKHRPESRTRV